MKIIGIDNFGRESVADWLIAENVVETFAEAIADFLNKDASNSSTYWYKAVDDDHKLWRGMEELV